MFIDKSVNDHSALVAKKILNRGLSSISFMLDKLFGSSEFTYVACPDFSISLRQRRLILGLPIGGYVNWSKYKFFPLELDVNSCGLHVIKFKDEFNPELFRKNLHLLKNRMDRGELVLNGREIKWNFSRRNHFINIYKDNEENVYVIFHSAGETVLFDWDYLHANFNVEKMKVEGREIPFIKDDDVEKYWQIAERDNAFFFERHKYIF
ncbi:MAG: hypothetical protein ACYC5A_08520, partial [Thermoleophilia bacterium]